MLSTLPRSLRSRGFGLPEKPVPRFYQYYSSIARTTPTTTTTTTTTISSTANATTTVVQRPITTSTLRSRSFRIDFPFSSATSLKSCPDLIPLAVESRRSFSTTPTRLTPPISHSAGPAKMPEYKLRDLTSLKDLKNGDMQEAGVEGFEDGKGKVLLVKLGDGEVHAMNANCTHFGAPLKNGVLTPQGRLMCPWHGACFNVRSGDIEEAPAPDPLTKFEVVEKNGGVYIKGEESAIKNGRGKANVTCSAQGSEKVVIVGGGSGTFGAVQQLRESGFKGAITLVGNEPNLPIDRTKLSKALIPDAEKLLLRNKEWYSQASVEIISDTVTSIDFTHKSVSTKSGSKISYTKLILATGGTPRRLPLPGFKDLKNIFVLRTVSDVQDIMKAVGEKKGKKIAVVGSSFIGMEVGNALAKDNTVTIIGMEKAPLERIMGEEVGKIFQKILEKNGVNFSMGASVESATPSSTDPGSVGAVKLKGEGPPIEADLVVLGVGVAPATEYLKENSSVTLEKDGSVRVDEKFRVQGVDDVFAIGDIATYPYHGPGGEGSPTRIEHWNVAQNGGKAVGRTIASPSAPPSSTTKTKEHAHFIPIFWSALGAQLRYCGNTSNGWDGLVLKRPGGADDNKFAAYYAKGETVVAVASMMMDPVMVKCAELMSLGKMPTKTELEKGVDPLEVDLGFQI